jgi:tRNA threonylcarbamoyladenosine biosynthesis protein TsaB
VALILALDTTNETGSMALLRGADLLEETELVPESGFCEMIFQEIAGLLDRHALKLSDVDIFAAASGPGSFTGGRVSMTAAKGLAEMNGRLVAPVPNLMAVAYQASHQETTSAIPLAPVLDVRREQVAGAVYSPNLDCLLEPLVASPEAFAVRAAEFGNVLYCGPDVARFAPPGAAFTATPRALAGAIARLAAGRGVDPAVADVEYIRRAEPGKAW